MAQGFFLGALTSDDLVNFVENDSRSEQLAEIGNVRLYFLSLGAAGEELDPAGRVKDDQKRSFFSRSPETRIPLSDPR
jgi:hypothetical protein